jgi:hypothetical protein
MHDAIECIIDAALTAPGKSKALIAIETLGAPSGVN